MVCSLGFSTLGETPLNSLCKHRKSGNVCVCMCVCSVVRDWLVCQCVCVCVCQCACVCDCVLSKGNSKLIAVLRRPNSLTSRWAHVSSLGPLQVLCNTPLHTPRPLPSGDQERPSVFKQMRTPTPLTRHSGLLDPQLASTASMWGKTRPLPHGRLSQPGSPPPTLLSPRPPRSPPSRLRPPLAPPMRFLLRPTHPTHPTLSPPPRSLPALLNPTHLALSPPPPGLPTWLTSPTLLSPRPLISLSPGSPPAAPPWDSVLYPGDGRAEAGNARTAP